MSRVKALWMMAGLLLAAAAAADEPGSQVSGNWEVHYSIVPTGFLQAEVANAYRITRSADRALLTIAVTRRDAPYSGSVPAKVSGMRSNLIDTKELDFRMLHEYNSTSYLSEVPQNGEKWFYEIDVLPEGDTSLAKPIHLHLEKTFDTQP